MRGGIAVSLHRAILVLVVLGAAAALHPVGASCWNSVAFGQLSPNCGEGYCYIVSPGTNTSASVLGAFWTFGAGNPVQGSGSDNGSWTDDSWLLPGGPGRHYLVGDWAQSSAIDGCISGAIAPGKTAEIMVAALSDQDSSGSVGYFAVATARRVQGAWPEIDFTFVSGGGTPSDIFLVEIPHPAAVYDLPSHMLTFLGPSLTSVSPGFHADASLTAGEAILGYRLYSMTTLPTSRLRSAGWTPASDVVPLGQTTALSFYCVAAPIYYAISLVYESGFESAHLSRSLPVNCRCVDADRDGYSSDIECPPDGPWDCDDQDASVHPGASEVCNGKDDNCNWQVDENAQGVDSDGDGIHNACDDCPLDQNPSQSDVDQDGLGDGCDLDDGLVYVHYQNGNEFDWQDEPLGSLWNLYQGDIDVLRATGTYTQAPGSNPLASRHCQEAVNSFEDFTTPDEGKLMFSLVTARDGGTESSLGKDSHGNERPNTNPCP